jgi:hypothetical protein
LAQFRFGINRYLRFSEETVRRDGLTPAAISAAAGAQGISWPGLGDHAGISRPTPAASPQRGRTGQPGAGTRARAAGSASKRQASSASAADTAGRASPDTRQRAAPRRVVADGRGTQPSELGQHASGRARNPRDYPCSGPRDIITVIIPAYVVGTGGNNYSPTKAHYDSKPGCRSCPTSSSSTSPGTYLRPVSTVSGTPTNYTRTTNTKPPPTPRKPAATHTTTELIGSHPRWLPGQRLAGHSDSLGRPRCGALKTRAPS